MLKVKIYKAVIIFSGFISVAMASGSKFNDKKPTNAPSAINKIYGHHFDSSGLCSCIPIDSNDVQVKSLRVQLNKIVAPFVKEYNRKNGFFLNRTRQRITPYFTMIDSAFEQCGLPVELKYLAYIESGLKYNAISRAGAVGPWAFMPVAAKQYGLKITKNHDERLNCLKSSIAAAGLLTDLYDKFGDWLLVIAAYNCGPGAIQKAIKKSDSHNYWSLQTFLPKETRMHVKKFIAVHYYFEGHGSLVTMSRSETQNHIQLVEAFVCRQQELGNAILGRL